MTRLVVQVAVMLMGLWTAVVLLLRALPYDDSELRAFLTPPEGCPAPCFMGIRPGVTTVEEATAILKTSGWVSNGNVKWELIKAHSTGYLTLTISDNVIYYVTLHMDFDVADLLTAYGVPSQLQPEYYEDGHEEYFLDYPSEHMVVVVEKRVCGLLAFLDSRININLLDNPYDLFGRIANARIEPVELLTFKQLTSCSH